MSGFDYVKLGEVRIRADRAEAKAAAYEVIGDEMAKYIIGLGRTSEVLRSAWQEARAWDGSPTPDRAHPTSRRRVTASATAAMSAGGSHDVTRIDATRSL